VDLHGNSEKNTGIEKAKNKAVSRTQQQHFLYPRQEYIESGAQKWKNTAERLFFESSKITTALFLNEAIHKVSPSLSLLSRISSRENEEKE